jgi:hypothetical protein
MKLAEKSYKKNKLGPVPLQYFESPSEQARSTKDHHWLICDPDHILKIDCDHACYCWLGTNGLVSLAWGWFKCL